MYGAFDESSRPSVVFSGNPMGETRMTESITNRIRPDDDAGYNDEALFAQDDRAYLTAALTVVGFAFYWTTIAVILFSSTFGPLTTRPMDGLVLRLVFLVGMFAASIVAGARPGRSFALWTNDVRMRDLVRLVALATLALMSLGASIEGWGRGAPVLLQAVCWLAFGVSMGLILQFWGFVWKGIDADRAENSFCSTCVAASVFIAAAASTFMLFAPTPVCIAATFVLFAASSALQKAGGLRVPTVDPLGEPSSRPGIEISRDLITPMAPAVAMGVALALCGLCLGARGAFPVALSGVAAGSLVALAVIRVGGRTPRASTVERIAFPLFGICLLLLPHSIGTKAFGVVEAVLIADLTCYLVFHWNILVALSYRLRLHPVHHFGQGLIATTAGLAIGWALPSLPAAFAAGSLSAYSIDGWGTGAFPELLTLTSFGGIGFTASTLAVVFLLVATAVVPYASNKTTEPLFGGMEDPAVEAFIEETRGGLTSEAFPGETRENANDARVSWDHAAEIICDEFHLTPREREVFALVARGRNAEHIGKQLFISVHTTKTHMSRIYRKLEVNSQQQIIDMVDERMGDSTVDTNSGLRRP